MDWYWWVAIVFVIWFVVAGWIGLLVGKVLGRRRAMEEQMGSIRKTIIEPREDAQRVTRDASKPKGHSRVTTAHVSQRRKDWN